MANTEPQSPLRNDTDAKLPAAAYLRYAQRADGWSAGRQAACLAHLADNGLITDAVRSVGMSVGGCYALRRQARGYAFDLGWDAALIIARRIVADNLMTAAIKGEESRWVREDGVTTYTRQNTKLSLTLLERVNPATALPEVLAVATRFDCYLQMIDEGLSARELWELFFDAALPHSEIEARERVRAALLLSEDSAGFDEQNADKDDADIEYKSMDGAPGCKGSLFGSRKAAKPRRDRVFDKAALSLQRRSRDQCCDREMRFAQALHLGGLAALRDQNQRQLCLRPTKQHSPIAAKPINTQFKSASLSGRA
jgi:hypothetical protein